MERQLHRLLIRMSRHICNQSSLGDLGSCLLNPGGAHLHHSLPPSLWRELLASWKPDGGRPPLHTSGAPPSTIAEVPLIATARAGVYTVVAPKSSLREIKSLSGPNIWVSARCLPKAVSIVAGTIYCQQGN